MKPKQCAPFFSRTNSFFVCNNVPCHCFVVISISRSFIVSFGICKECVIWAFRWVFLFRLLFLSKFLGWLKINRTKSIRKKCGWAQETIAKWFAFAFVSFSSVLVFVFYQFNVDTETSIAGISLYWVSGGEHQAKCVHAHLFLWVRSDQVEKRNSMEQRAFQ